VSELPRGTVTLVFTDIEGSTRLLASLGSRYEMVLGDHRRVLRDAFSSHGGVEVDTQGDALFYAFAKAHDAVTAAVEGQRALASHDFGQGVELRVRMGIHTGEPTVGLEGYVGQDVHLGARICAASWGAQIVASSATAALVSWALKDVTLRPLGDHALKDIDERVELHQVEAPGLRADFPVLRTVGTHPTNLPPRLSPLIGRDQDLAALKELLGSPETSVISLVGPGGTGKTSLAAALGAKMLPLFPDGVFFVELSALTDASLVVPAIAQALSLRESSGRSLQEILREHVSSKEMLLILDNFEQVMGAAPEVSSLVRETPALKALVTSREALRLQGEKEFPVAPLALPSSSYDPEAVAESPAVTLFLARAHDVWPDFHPSPSDLTLVADICRRLDGLPLAIELAAARVKVFSLAALNERLKQSLKVLTSGRRDASARQRTLRGAISWSYDLLTPDEQALFRRVGVFAGGFTLEAAEAVCDRGDLDTDLLEGLASLVEKNLVRTDELRERFSLLETIREFAAEKLEESGEGEETRRAHAEFFRTLVEEAEPHLTGPEQDKWLGRLEADHDNIRSALEWWLAHDGAGAAATAGSLWRFWDVRGYFTEGRSWLERSLDSDICPAEVTARVLHGLASLAEAQGDYGSVESSGHDALTLFRRLDKPREVAGSLGLLGWSAYRQGDLARAKTLCEEAVDTARDAGDVWALGRALIGLGAVLGDEGDHMAAAAAFEEALALQRRVDDHLGAATTLLNLGDLALHDGDAPQAKIVLEEALEHARRLGDTWTMCAAMANLGLVSLMEDEVSEASRLLSDSLVLARQMGSPYVVATVLEAMGCVAAHEKHVRRSGTRFGAAHKLRQEGGVPVTPSEERFYETFLRSIRKSQHSGEWEEGWKDGHSMSAEQAVALAATAL
jgi:predicted ATPase/class 3 adenylate cyclase